MKKILSILFISILFYCDTAMEVANAVLTQPAESNQLTETDVKLGLKEALNVAIKNSVLNASATNGFWNNDLIKIPFPQDAIDVKNKLVEKGLLTNQITKFEQTLNQAAEEATKEALPIFTNAITKMSISDAFNLLNGGENAVTEFFKKTTTSELMTAFSPKVQNAINKVELTKYWEPIISKYNMLTLLTGKDKINTDLNNYVSQKAVDGLFTLMASEENKIRKDPQARVTSILQKVFGSIDKK